ncbi:MAG: cytochrome c biogenesis protein CcsA [Deltaproteobacteria bacterium]|nr:cytochrome c biogenesis protein CcsA [Deltaproteobacteria bacterium]
MPATISYSNGFLVVLGSYILATVFYCLRSIFGKKILSAIALRITVAALIIHAIFLGSHLLEQGYPFLVSPFDTFQLVSFCVVFTFVLLCFLYRFFATGLILLPAGLVFNILSLTTLVRYRAPGHFLENPWAFIHLVFVFIGLAVFMVSFVVGIIYLIQEYRIKHKKTGGLFERFPPLEILDHIHYRSLYIGFVFFTIGIITGGGWSKSMVGVYVTGDLKQLLSFGAWIFFALFLNLRVSRGWVGRRGILLSCIGFAAVFFLFTWVQRL